jgi:hypothetical protein
MLSALDNAIRTQSVNDHFNRFVNQYRLVHKDVAAHTVKAELFRNVSVLTCKTVALHTDHQAISKLSCKPEQPNMTRMKNIEKASHKDCFNHAHRSFLPVNTTQDSCHTT